MDLGRQFSTYLLGKKCQVYAAPFDVMFPEGSLRDEDITTVVQPDLVVVCDESKLVDRGCLGVPDLVVEILSPATGRKDMREKLSLFERAGVREYWIVHPFDLTVEVFALSESGRYGKPEVYGPGDELRVGIFDDLTIDLEQVFSE
jgi:Uma2 family endonuclease